MLTLFAFLSAIGSGSAAVELPGLKAVEAERPPIRLWMNSDRRYRPGDRVRLQVDADADGYLLVLNYDTDGRVRVLFPLDPRDDAMVRAGRRYEVRDGNAQEAFRAGVDGTGLIFSALSRDPWRFEEWVLADRWDNTRLEIDPRSNDPETELANLVQGIAGPNGFDYDVIGYRVYGETSYSHTNVYSNVYLHDSYLNCYSYSWSYNSCRGWPNGGWAYGFGYSRYGYGYGYPYGYGYDPFGYGRYYPYRPGNFNRGPVLVGRPRNYAVHPRPTLGSRTALGGGTFSGALPSGRNSATRSTPPIDWRSRARPVSGNAGRSPEVVSRGGGGDRAPQAAPPARRARPESVNYPAPRAVERGGDRGGYDRRGNDNGSREAPAARGRDDGARSAPPPRSEPARRDPPPARAEPSRSGGGGGSSPPPSPPPSRPRRP